MKSKHFLLISFLLLFPFSNAEPESLDDLDYVFTHLARYPEMEASDLYKLIYQANNGAAHYGIDKENILNYLLYECESLSNERNQPIEIIESIGPNYVRIHLVPYMANGYSLKLLADFFYQSMKNEEKLSQFRESWQDIIKISRTTELANIRTSDLIDMDVAASESGYRPFHHSQKYRTLYSPHYRILSTSLADSLMERVSN